MLTERDLAAYIQRVRGQLIDVDGVFGAQCWDQWSHYATNFLGVPSWPTYTNAGGTGPHAGWACNVWHHFNSSGLAQWFDMVPAGQPLRAGDVPIWEYGTVWYPYSHIATLLEVRPNGMLRCLTQNPGAAQIADLIPRGLLGALRPKALTVGDFTASKTPTLTASYKRAELRRARRRKDHPMHYVILTEQARSDGSAAYAIYTPGVPGSWEEFDNFTARGMYANSLASQFGTGTEVTLKRWLQLQKKYA